MIIEVLFSPAEYGGLGARDLRRSTCVVFDILRATTTMITALSNGAPEIIPVSEIAEALALRAKDPNVLLAGERGGTRIEGFDLGNSPREFTADRVSEKRIAITTTNGTRALRACAHAAEVHVGSFLNMGAVARVLRKTACDEVMIVCAGTAEEASLEDTLAAGALCDLVPDARLRDSAQVARGFYERHQGDLLAAVKCARNGRKLLSMPDLAPDVEVSLRRDTLEIAARLFPDGAIRVNTQQ
jgi:2-phosphosulfolactate phosphatase